MTLKALGRDVLPANGNSARDSRVFRPIWIHWKQADAAFEVAYTSKTPLCKVDVEDFDIQQRWFADRDRVGPDGRQSTQGRYENA